MPGPLPLERPCGADTVRHLIVDRDGVLNSEAPDRGYVTTPDDWNWIPGVLCALADLKRAMIRVSVATNQSAVGRGLMTPADLEAIHARMIAEAVRAGGDIAAVFACPHSPTDGCNCRKPAPSLIREAIASSGIAADQTLVVGDDLRDIEAANAADVRSALVLTGKGKVTVTRLRNSRTPIYDDFGALVRELISRERVPGDRPE